MAALAAALKDGNHSQYIDNPVLLGHQTTTEDGNSILGHIFGSKDVSRAVAGHAAEQTGIGADVLKEMLPVVATMVMGALSKKSADAPVGAPTAAGSGILSSLLEQNREGSVAASVVGMLGRFLGGR